MALPSGAQSSGGKIIDADGVEVVRIDGTAGGSVLPSDPSVATAGAPEAAVSVTSTATLLQAANAARKEVRFQPTNGDIYVGFDNTVTTANGIRVPSGTIFIEDRWRGTVYAIAVGTVDLRRVELT